MKAWGAKSASTPIEPLSINRRDPLPGDVEMQILFCGVCHSDLHSARNEWGGADYPLVPGHEIVGRVKRVGRSVSKVKEGDLAAIGCMVDSCRTCASCTAGLEQYCEASPVFTYNSLDKHSGDKHSGGRTFGGYSERIVADEAFVLKVPAGLDLAATAPLLCAGITTYSPLRHWHAGPGKKVGIIGLGGLGHMGVKFAKAFGATVVLFTTSPGKSTDALRLGADDVVISTDKAGMKRHKGSFDFILDCVSASHDLGQFMSQLKTDGALTIVGAPPTPMQVHAFSLIGGRRSFAGSAIGGIAETQEMLEFCAANGIVSDIEKIRIQDINSAWDRMVRGDVKYRFVIDMATINA